MSDISVEPVAGKREFDAFVDFAYAINASDPNWVPPLRAEVVELLSPGKNPFHDHAKVQLFLARRDGKVAGRMAGGLARGATGVAFSFATTYALGQVARRYYAGGRTMSTQMLRDAYAATLVQTKGLQAQYAPQIEQQARTVDVSKIVQMVRAN